MVKKADSLRSLGKMTIAVDYPTKTKLQAAANAKGLTLSELLRQIANSLVDDGKQLQMSSIQSPAIASASLVEKITNFEKKLDAVLEAGGINPNYLDPEYWVNRLRFSVGTPEEQKKRYEAKAAEIAAQLRDSVQPELKVQNEA